MLPAFSLVMVNNSACHSSVFAGNSTNENIEAFRRLLDSKIDNRILSGFFLQQARRRSSVKLAYRAFLPLPGFFSTMKEDVAPISSISIVRAFRKKKKKKNNNKTTNLRTIPLFLWLHQNKTKNRCYVDPLCETGFSYAVVCARK